MSIQLKLLGFYSEPYYAIIDEHRTFKVRDSSKQYIKEHLPYIAVYKDIESYYDIKDDSKDIIIFDFIKGHLDIQGDIDIDIVILKAINICEGDSNILCRLSNAYIVMHKCSLGLGFGVNDKVLRELREKAVRGSIRANMGNVLHQYFEYDRIYKPYLSHDASGEEVSSFTAYRELCEGRGLDGSGDSIIIGSRVVEVSEDRRIGEYLYSGGYDRADLDSGGIFSGGKLRDSIASYLGVSFYSNELLSRVLSQVGKIGMPIVLSGITHTLRFIFGYPYNGLLSSKEMNVRAVLAANSRYNDIVSIDFDSFEMRTFCMIAGIDTISFEDIAGSIFGVVDSHSRGMAKRLFYAYLYSANGDGIRGFYSGDIEEAKAIIGLYVDEAIKDMIDSTKGDYLYNKFTGLVYKVGKSIVNTYVQSTASYLFLKVLYKVIRDNRYRVVYHLHDEIVIESRDSSDNIRDYFNSVIGSITEYALPIKMKRGSSYGNLERV